MNAFLSTTANLAQNNTAIYNVDRTSRNAKPSLTDAPNKRILRKNITTEVRKLVYDHCIAGVWKLQTFTTNTDGGDC